MKFRQELKPAHRVVTSQVFCFVQRLNSWDGSPPSKGNHVAAYPAVAPDQRLLYCEMRVYTPTRIADGQGENRRTRSRYDLEDDRVKRRINKASAINNKNAVDGSGITTSMPSGINMPP